MSSFEVFVGLGSNQDSPGDQLARAVERLASSLPLTRLSSWYRSPPFEAPAQANFLNAVAAFRTSLAPESMLELCQRVEQAHSRRRDTFRGPRTLDLDLLLHGDVCLAAATLTIPHAELHRRRFVLEPLFEIAPEVVHPRLRRSVAELHERCPDPGPVLRVDGSIAWKALVAAAGTISGKAEPVF